MTPFPTCPLLLHFYQQVFEIFRDLKFHLQQFFSKNNRKLILPTSFCHKPYYPTPLSAEILQP